MFTGLLTRKINRCYIPNRDNCYNKEHIQEHIREQHSTKDIQEEVEDEIKPVIEQPNIEVIKPEV